MGQNTIRLTPGHGMYLTQAGEISITERIVASEVFLAADDSPGNWREITGEEAAVYEAAKGAAIEAKARESAAIAELEAQAEINLAGSKGKEELR